MSTSSKRAFLAVAGIDLTVRDRDDGQAVRQLYVEPLCHLGRVGVVHEPHVGQVCLRLHTHRPRHRERDHRTRLHALREGDFVAGAPQRAEQRVNGLEVRQKARPSSDRKRHSICQRSVSTFTSQPTGDCPRLVQFTNLLRTGPKHAPQSVHPSQRQSPVATSARLCPHSSSRNSLETPERT